MANANETNRSDKRPNLLKSRVKEFIENAKTLQGEPGYIATGMAIGVFIGVTPTFPFHTVLALTLAFAFRGSKPAAVLGVWFGNPLTMPFFYLGSYKIGMLILGNSVPFDIKYTSIRELLKLGLNCYFRGMQQSLRLKLEDLHQMRGFQRLN